jgi:hypothetical protein
MRPRQHAADLALRRQGRQGRDTAGVRALQKQRAVRRLNKQTPSAFAPTCSPPWGLLFYRFFRNQTNLMCAGPLTWKFAGEPDSDCTLTPHFSGSSPKAARARLCTQGAMQTGAMCQEGPGGGGSQAAPLLRCGALQLYKNIYVHYLQALPPPSPLVRHT